MLRSRATKSMEIISVLKDNVLHCFQLFILVLVFFRRGNQCDQRKSPTKFITKSCHDRVHFTWAVLEFSALADCVVCCKSNYTILYTMMPLLMLYEWVNDCYLMPTQQLFSYIMAKTNYRYIWIKSWRYLLCTGPTLLHWIFIEQADWNNSRHVDISLHGDTLSWFRANYLLLLLPNDVCFVEKQQLSPLIWPVPDSNPRSTTLDANTPNHCVVLFVLVLCVLYPMLLVYLDCPFLVDPWVFSTVYLQLNLAFLERG